MSTSNGHPVNNLNQAEQDTLDKLNNPDQFENNLPKYEWSHPTQLKILSAIANNLDYFNACYRSIKPSYFRQDELRIIYQIILDFHQQYKQLPSSQDVKMKIEIKYDEQHKHKPYIMSIWEEIYGLYEEWYTKESLMDMLTQFGREASLMEGFYKSGKIIKDPKNDMWKDIKNIFVEACELNLDTDEKYNSYTLPEYLKYCNQHSTEWVIDGVLAFGSLTLFAGREKKGKSTALFNLQVSQASGTKWLNHFIVQQVPVVLIDYENPSGFIGDNLQKLLTERNIDPTNLINNFHVPKQLPIGITKEWLESYIKKLPTDQIGVIYIDSARASLQNLTDVPNWENNASEVRRMLDPIQKFSHETGWAVVLIHHYNKGGSVSGSTEWCAVPDYAWTYTGVDGEHSSYRRELEFTGRYTRNKPDNIYVDYVDNTLQYVGSKTALAKRQYQSKQEDKINVVQTNKEKLHLLLLEKPMTRNELMVSLSITKTPLRNLLQDCVGDGIIHFEKQSNDPTLPELIHLTEKGMKNN